MSTTIFRGPGFEDCFIALPSSGIIYMIPVISIEENDDLTIGVEVKEYDGDPIAVYHGETQVGTISNYGPATIPFTAGDNTNECSLRSTGDASHQIGSLDIVKDA